MPVQFAQNRCYGCYVVWLGCLSAVFSCFLTSVLALQLQHSFTANGTMAISDYSAPLTQLLFLGECSTRGSDTWMDYRSLNISAIDIPHLIKMATDHDLYELDAEATAGWAPIHAWRALGQLGATQAVAPLLQQT